MSIRVHPWFCLIALLAACSTAEPERPGSLAPAPAALVPLDVAACREVLRDEESPESFQQALLRSGAYFEEEGDPTVAAFGRRVARADLRGIVQTAASALSPEGIGQLVCDRYRVYRVELPAPLQVRGYGEPVLEARREPDGVFRFGVYEPPVDLVEVDLRRFCPKCDRRIVQGRVASGQVVPYYSRYEIQSGVLAGNDYELGWLADPLDLFLLQLRGAGILRFGDGTTMYLTYASANGYPPSDIGDRLVRAGKLPAGDAMLADIGGYLRAQTHEAQAVMEADQRVGFFGVVAVGPVGRLGIPLTPGRTLAVNARHYPRGGLAFLRRSTPGGGTSGHFVLIQDSGLGLRDAGQVALFQGAGADAVARAAALRQQGEIYLVLPN